jgi:hypothetical protein
MNKLSFGSDEGTNIFLILFIPKWSCSRIMKLLVIGVKVLKDSHEFVGLVVCVCIYGIDYAS